MTFKSAPPIPPMIITGVYNALIHLKQIGTQGRDGLDGKILKLSAPVISDNLTFTIFVYRNVTFRLLSGRPKSFLFLSLERVQIRQTVGQFLSCQLSQSLLRNT